MHDLAAQWINLWGNKYTYIYIYIYKYKNIVALIVPALNIGSFLAANLLYNVVSQKISNIFSILLNFLGASLVVVSYITFFRSCSKRSHGPESQ